MWIGETKSKKKQQLEFHQGELFPTVFSPHYKVMNHHCYIINGKSVWSSSEITWYIKEKKDCLKMDT